VPESGPGKSASRADDQFQASNFSIGGDCSGSVAIHVLNHLVEIVAYEVEKRIAPDSG
jgi:hypothetical protein